MGGLNCEKNPPRVRRQNSMSKQLASHDFASKPKPAPTMRRQNSMSKQLASHDFASKPVSVSVLSDSESISIIPDPKSAPGASDPQPATVSDALDPEDIIVFFLLFLQQIGFKSDRRKYFPAVTKKLLEKLYSE